MSGRRDVVLVGGPLDGRIVASTGSEPVILLDEPREPSLLEPADMLRVEWDEALRWYVFRGGR